MCIHSYNIQRYATPAVQVAPRACLNATNCHHFVVSRRFSQVVNCCLYFIKLSGTGMVTLLTDDSDIESLKKRSGRGNAAIAVGTKASPQAAELAVKNSVNVQSLSLLHISDPTEPY